jgi:hypothetical protein
MTFPRGSAILSTFALASCLVAGCTDAPLDANATAISLPLIQPGPSGTVYRLSASFDITAPDGSVRHLDATGDDPSVVVTVTPGINTIRLLDGWTLSRSSDGVTFTPAPAVLASLNPVNLRIAPNRNITFAFDFIVRNATTELHLTFGVTEQPRQLFGGVFFDDGSGDFAGYAGQRADMALYFDAPGQQLTVEGDGTHAREYFSGITALEFFNDARGQLAPFAAGFAGGQLDFTTRIHPDQSADFSGSDQAFDPPFALITFDRSDLVLFSTDADGFPADQAFFAIGVPITFTVNGATVLHGRLSSLREIQ